MPARSPRPPRRQRSAPNTGAAELISQALQRFCDGKVGLSYIPPGTPWNNAYIESFHNRLRKERLNRNHWTNLREA
jgi:putative transposase